MARFEIVKGDYGKVYRGVLENEDLSDHTAVLYIWDKDRTMVIDGKACAVSLVGTDTRIEYTVESSDFEDAELGQHYGLFKLTKTGAVERTLRFTWEVFEKEP